jgi:hypothetical protein
VSNGTGGKAAQGLGLAAAKPVLPFTPVSPYPWTGAPDPALQKALAAAAGDQANISRLGTKAHVPFSMIALATDGKHRYAGVSGTDMDFSGSLLKVAVMYAAFELRAAANRLIAALGIPYKPGQPQALPPAVPDAFNAPINDTADVRVRGKPGGQKFPKYDTILRFTGIGAPVGPVEFTDAFQTNLTGMIVHSGDAEAGACIRALGYAYLNAVLKTAGFFTPGARKGKEEGIWIAGDYESAPQVRIAALNDGSGALVMTTEAMCRLVAMIETGELVNDSALHGQSNLDMQDLLLSAAKGPDTPFISKVSSPLPFSIAKNKLGWAHLGRGEKGPAIASEASVLVWNATDPATAKKLADHKLTGTLVICWQNVNNDEVTEFDPIADIVTQTYRAILS